MIIPALDLIEGQVVRLHQGDYTQQRHYALDPVEQFNNYVEQGATCLHLVDLTGAKQPEKRQIQLIEKIAQQTSALMQMGGGIRHAAEIDALLNVGVTRVVIGSLAITQPERVEHWFTQYGGERLVLALDVNINAQGERFVAIHGWQETSALTIENVIERFLPLGLKHVLCTDIAKDGTLQGPNFALYQALCQQYPHIAFQASGGMSQFSDFEALIDSGVSGIIVGRALLEGRMTVKECVECYQRKLSLASM